ncbi:hypothetical protein BDZ89DRAFT_1061421, partial [Hymenopellis radicata]
ELILALLRYILAFEYTLCRSDSVSSHVSTYRVTLGVRLLSTELKKDTNGPLNYYRTDKLRHDEEKGAGNLYKDFLGTSFNFRLQL